MELSMQKENGHIKYCLPISKWWGETTYCEKIFL